MSFCDPKGSPYLCLQGRNLAGASEPQQSRGPLLTVEAAVAGRVAEQEAVGL
jgi:hypothetical protein